MEFLINLHLFSKQTLTTVFDIGNVSTLTHSVLRLFYWQATGALSLIPSFTLSYLYKTPVYVPILSVNWIYQLTGYILCPMKWSNTGNVQKIDDLMYLNARRLQSALGIQSMFLTTTIVVASIEWVKQLGAVVNIFNLAKILLYECADY